MPYTADKLFRGAACLHASVTAAQANDIHKGQWTPETRTLLIPIC